jgi:choline kinase
MGAMTEDRPKCLLPVGGQTLLEHQLATLSALGVAMVTIVTGYCSDQVRERVDGRASFIENDDWAVTNSLYSFALCRDAAMCESLLVLNGDVIAHPAIVERVLRAPRSAFAYDSTSGSDEEHMKVELRGDRLHSMSKDLPRARVHGENVGILRFQGPAPRLLFQEAESVLKRAGGTQWLAAAVQGVAQRAPLYGLDVANLPWREIDFPEDLIAARSITWPALRGPARQEHAGFQGARTARPAPPQMALAGRRRRHLRGRRTPRTPVAPASRCSELDGPSWHGRKRRCTSGPDRTRPGPHNGSGISGAHPATRILRLLRTPLLRPLRDRNGA